MVKNKILITLLFFLFLNQNTFSSEVRYKTYIGNCPSKAANALIVQLFKLFEETRSLMHLKKKIISEEMEEKYFLSEYKISYDPFNKILNFSFECPKPLLSIQVYKNGPNENGYSAVLASNGKLYDPVYEEVYNDENKLKTVLPSLAFPVSAINNGVHVEMANIVSELDPDFYKVLAEMIISEGDELTVILAIKNKSISAFLGKEGWDEKLKKLQKIVEYMEINKKIPTSINITNIKKIVVKF